MKTWTYQHENGACITVEAEDEVSANIELNCIVKTRTDWTLKIQVDAMPIIPVLQPSYHGQAL